MTRDQELLRLKKDELLRILLELEEDNERLAAENRELMERLATRELVMRDAGSIAEAARKLSQMFEAAQKEADAYAAGTRRQIKIPRV